MSKSLLLEITAGSSEETLLRMLDSLLVEALLDIVECAGLDIKFCTYQVHGGTSINPRQQFQLIFQEMERSEETLRKQNRLHFVPFERRCIFIKHQGNTKGCTGILPIIV
ncbi:uncharacterized protein LOC143039376 [Oratosquilla oratoria]|uniref:uncharacterized protein LOC143039376 n=1 Tax=Oratosquilla oratoria TaxID=337810 RepID=UPI003F7708C1